MIAIKKAKHNVMASARSGVAVNPRYVAKVAVRAKAWGFDVEQDQDDLSVLIARPGALFYSLMFFPDEDSPEVVDFERGDPVVITGSRGVHEVDTYYKQNTKLYTTDRKAVPITLVHHVVE